MGTPLKVRTAVPCTTAAELINQVSLGLMHGTLAVRSSEQRHVYHLGQVIQLEIRAEENEREGSMQISLHWQVPLSVTTSP